MERKIGAFLKGHALTILSVWFVSALGHYTLNSFAQSRENSRVNEIRSRAFSDYMLYRDIFPSESIVEYGAEAFYKSDSEVRKAPFFIEWREIIECDHNPYDGVDLYEFYAQAVTTSYLTTETRERPTKEMLDKKRGFPATSEATGQPITYPSHDANCRLNSAMTITVELGITFDYHRISKDALIRGKRHESRADAIRH